jgi:hypothetical protein
LNLSGSGSKAIWKAMPHALRGFWKAASDGPDQKSPASRLLSIRI